ncbi:MAG: helix-turn-helix domain-containing protein [Oscillospiraceae bacterium]
MNVLSLLEDKNSVLILDLLNDYPDLTIKETAVRLCINENTIAMCLKNLADAEAVSINNGKYSICRQTFEKSASRLMDYCSDKNNSSVSSEPLIINTKAALENHFFNQRETGIHHASFEREVSFYESVCSGNLELVKTLFTQLGGEGFGVLSHNPLRNLKYHLIVSIAMITRFCINAGMPHEEAYNLSDVYILKTDASETEQEIRTLHYNMSIDFTKRMRQIRNCRNYSKPVIKALDYISDNLHKRILVRDIADFLSLSISYLSKLFKSEIGISINEYITIKKIEAAANMIQFSDYSALEISNYFNFSSHSYFIKIFKKHMGMTPHDYKKKYYSVAWMKNGSSEL